VFFSNINGFLNVISDSSKKGEKRVNSTERGMVVGPINLINNSYFSQVSDWVTEDAIALNNSIIIVDYDNKTSPSYMTFRNGAAIDNSPFSYKAYLNQSFFKPIKTPDHKSALVLKFDYFMATYFGIVGLPPGTAVTGEIHVRIKNVTSGETGSWSPVAGASAFTSDIDPRINISQSVRLDVGEKTGSLDITQPGLYLLSIYLQVSSGTVDSPVVFDLDLRIDNVTLSIEDNYEPLVIANNDTFGPFKNASVALVDVDFSSGGAENTTLKEGKYRLNNSGTPSPWYIIFQDREAYTNSWSIASIWEDMVEGNNTIDIYCMDEAGNYNDSIQVIAVKDTILPDSKVNTLPDIMSENMFEVKCTTHDLIAGIDYIELWYEYNNVWYKWLGVYEEAGRFNKSSIIFKTDQEGIFGFYSVAYDKAGNVELNGTPDQNPLIVPDTETLVDYTDPNIKFYELSKSIINRNVTLTVNASEDTTTVEFFYWVDVDEDGETDVDDKGSSWNMITRMDAPLNDTYWSIQWNTTDYEEFPEFEDKEPMVILKAVAMDRAENFGEDILDPVEVDNKVPALKYTTDLYKPNLRDLFVFINYTTDPDTDIINIYNKTTGDQNWNVLEDNLLHTFGDTTGSYKWKLTTYQRQILEIMIKVEAIDDAGNIGIGTSTPPPIDHPVIKDSFPTFLELFEDFNEKELTFTAHESHSNPNIKGDNLKWYITGNSENIFFITGNNNTGSKADTLTFRSVPDQFGTEFLTYHLIDHFGLEATIDQKVTIHPTPDPPILDLPIDYIHVKAGEPNNFDISRYVSDIDSNLSDLSLTTDDPDHVNVDGLVLIINYGTEFLGETKSVKITVSDVMSSVDDYLKLRITDNYPPMIIRQFPEGLTINSGETVENLLDLDDYFKDPEGDKLEFSFVSQNLVFDLEFDNQITVKAKENVGGLESIKIRAKDPNGGYIDGFLEILIIDINDPPLIKSIPDLYIHYYQSSDHKNYPGYSYDFSYFISDPDDDRSDLKVDLVPVDQPLFEHIDRDPSNNMRFIFKFPFEFADEKIHVIYIYVIDPDKEEARGLFNVTIIIENWPVELILPIPEQSFNATVGKPDAINLADHFFDRDGGTTYEIITQQNSMLEIKIDDNNYIDLAAIKSYFTGTEEVLILAKDSQPTQIVYAIFKVYVHGFIPDLPTITINLVESEQADIDLNSYVPIEYKPLSKFVIGTDDPVHISVENSILSIKYETPGNYIITYWVKDKDGFINKTGDILIEVEPKEESNGEVAIDYYIISIILLITVIIIILIVFFFVKHKKEEEKISSMPTTTVKHQETEEIIQEPFEDETISNQAGDTEQQISESHPQPTYPDIPTQTPSPTTSPTTSPTPTSHQQQLSGGHPQTSEQQVQPTKPAQHVQQAQPVQPTQPTQPAQPAQPAQPTKPVQQPQTTTTPLAQQADPPRQVPQASQKPAVKPGKPVQK
jgi:hypothetical protein